MPEPVIITTKSGLTATLYCGDCRDIIPTLPKVDCVITDPPYGVDFKGKETKHTQAGGGYISGDSDIGPAVLGMILPMVQRGIVFPGMRLMFKYAEPYEIGGVYCPSGAGSGRWGFAVLHPMLFYGKATEHGRRSPSGFESFDTVVDNGHPCPKPERWMEWCVKKATNKGETVLDPFMGSGTTCVAALRHGCNFVGIEREPAYFAIAERRIRAEAAKAELFAQPAPATTGKLF